MLNLPNILTMSRIIVIPIVIALFYWDGATTRWVACLLFSAAGITDFFDGYLARRANQVSRFGRFLDPIADKLLVAAVILYLANRDMSLTEMLPAVVILLREILVSGLREFLAELRVSLPVTKLAKYKTTAQMFALGFLIVGDMAPPWIHARDVGDVLLWAAALVTLITGYDYLKAGIAHMASYEPPAAS